MACFHFTSKSQADLTKSQSYRKIGRQNLPCADSPSGWSQRLKLDQANAKSQELYPQISKHTSGFLLLFPGIQKRVGLKVELKGLGPVSIWDTSIKGSSVTHYTRMLALSYLFDVYKLNYVGFCICTHQGNWSTTLFQCCIIFLVFESRQCWFHRSLGSFNLFQFFDQFNKNLNQFSFKVWLGLRVTPSSPDFSFLGMSSLLL